MRRLPDKNKERVMGIEPTYPAWKAGVLPLNYTRINAYINLKTLIILPQKLIKVNFVSSVHIIQNKSRFSRKFEKNIERQIA